MKLFYTSGSSALVPHIVLCEAGIEHTIDKVDLHNKKTSTGADFWAINPKGYVPVLQLNDGSYLTEAAVIVQYLADLVPDKKLAPVAGTMERYRLMETLNFLSSEVHKNFYPLFKPDSPDNVKEAAVKMLKHRLGLLEKQLDGVDFLAGSQFSVADAYLFVLLLWAKFSKMPMEDWPNLQAFKARVAARPAVQVALTAEGFTKR